jgi:hypothetical protein
LLMLIMQYKYTKVKVKVTLNGKDELEIYFLLN